MSFCFIIQQCYRKGVLKVSDTIEEMGFEVIRLKFENSWQVSPHILLDNRLSFVTFLEYGDCMTQWVFGISDYISGVRFEKSYALASQLDPALDTPSMTWLVCNLPNITLVYDWP